MIATVIGSYPKIPNRPRPARLRNAINRLDRGDITVEELDQLDTDAETLMDEAVKFADESPFPEPVELYDDVYVDYPKELMKRGVNMSV